MLLGLHKYSYLVRFTDLRGESRKRCKRGQCPGRHLGRVQGAFCTLGQQNSAAKRAMSAVDVL